MIKAGADPNAIDKDGANVLFYSLNKDNHDIIKALVDYGAKIDNIITFKVENHSYSSTVLGLLCFLMGTQTEEFTEEYFSVKDIQNLISLGADVNCKVEIKSDSIININLLWCFGSKCLRKDKYEILECLLKNGVDLKYKIKGVSFLADYVQQEPIDKFIDLLVKYGADINEIFEFKDEQSGEIRQGNLLNFAIFNEAFSQNINKLISFGGNLNYKLKIKEVNENNYAFFPNVILTALNKEHVCFNVLKLLLDNGESINSLDSLGRHILFHTFREGDIRKLVHLGADPYLETPEGISFLLFKYLYAHDSFEKKIINRDNFDKEIDLIIRLIKDLKYDINRISYNGYSLFMKIAMVAKHLKTIKSFVSVGGKVTSSNDYPILQLVSSNNENISIVDYFASFASTECLNESLIQAAEFNPNPSIAKLLIEKGADVKYYSFNKRESVLDVAKRNPNYNVLDTLKSISTNTSSTIKTNNPTPAIKSNNNYTSTRNNTYYESTKYTPGYTPSKSNNDFNNGCANGCGCLIWLLIIAACQGCMFLK